MKTSAAPFRGSRTRRAEDDRYGLLQLAMVCVCVAIASHGHGGGGGGGRKAIKLKQHHDLQEAYQAKLEAKAFDDLASGDDALTVAGGGLRAADFAMLLSRLHGGKPVDEDVVDLHIWYASGGQRGDAAMCARAASLEALRKYRHYRSHKQEIDELFARCDANADGKLSVDELRHALEIMEREVFSKKDNRLAPWVGFETEHSAQQSAWGTPRGQARIERRAVTRGPPPARALSRSLSLSLAPPRPPLDPQTR